MRSPRGGQTRSGTNWIHLSWQTPTRWARRDVALIGFLTCLVALAHAGTHAETDPFWQARAGMENLDGAVFRRPDSWSWAPVDSDFQQNSPGWNSLLGLSIRLLGIHDWGIPGLFIVTLVSIATLYALLALAAWRVGARAIPTLVGLVVLSVLGWIGLSARATVPALSLLVLGLLMAYAITSPHWRIPTSQRVIVATLTALAISAMGIWIHTSWLLFGPLLGLLWTVLWCGSGQMSRGTALVASAFSGAALAIGTLLGPYGASVWEFALRTREITSDLILEWRGLVTPPIQWTWWIIFGVCIASAVGALAIKVAPSRNALAVATGLAVLATSLGGFMASRFLFVALPLAVPLLALAMTRCMPVNATDVTRPRVYLSDPVQRVVWLGVLIIVAPIALFFTIPLAKPKSVSVASLLPDNCQLFADLYTSNTLTILRPDITNYWDGRFDYYGRERLLDGRDYLAGIKPAPVPPGTTCVAIFDIPELYASLRDSMDGTNEWRRMDSADGFIIWVKEDPVS